MIIVLAKGEHLEILDQQFNSLQQRDTILFAVAFIILSAMLACSKNFHCSHTLTKCQQKSNKQTTYLLPRCKSGHNRIWIFDKTFGIKIVYFSATKAHMTV